MKVGISLMRGAYTPEAYAYERYLLSNGVDVQLDYSEFLSDRNDLNIYFMGIRLSGKKSKAVEIHEYQSLSTPPLARVKDYLKVRLNKKPQGRIFLNNIVRERLSLIDDDVPFICRDMGVDKAFYQQPCSSPEFDIIYSGSINGRPGLVDELYKLARLGFKLIIVGEVDSSVRNRFLGFKGHVVFTGRVQRKELPELYRNCRAGLNFTPNIYPFNIQTSTKTLEYLASGLTVITNKYFWSERFFLGQEKHCVFLEDLKSYKRIRKEIGYFVGIENYEWDNVLRSSDFYSFLEGVIR